MKFRIRIGEREISFLADKKGDHGIILDSDSSHLDVEYNVISSRQQYLVVNGFPLNAYLVRDGNAATVIIRGVPYSLQDADIPDTRTRGRKGAQAIPQDVTPPMPAVVVRILVAAGDRVRQGQGVIVVESMKMETTLSAPSDGRVRALNVAAGDKVMPGQILVDIDRDDQVSTKMESQTG